MEVNNLLVSTADPKADSTEDNDGVIPKREQAFTPTSAVEQPPTTTTTMTLSPFGIEPGVCLKNVAAIITQQQHHATPPSPTQNVPTPKELTSEVLGGTKEKHDFHFDKHSQFTGMYLFHRIMNIWFPLHLLALWRHCPCSPAESSSWNRPFSLRNGFNLFRCFHFRKSIPRLALNQIKDKELQKPP